MHYDYNIHNLIRWKCFWTLWKKWNDLQLGFRVVMTICNSLQLSMFLQTWMLLIKLHESQWMQFTICGTVYVCNSCNLTIITCRNNIYAILMQLVCNYNVNVKLTLFFFDPSIFDIWSYGDFWVKLISFWNIDIHHPLGCK
jgi:hypothetical protein